MRTALAWGIVVVVAVGCGGATASPIGAGDAGTDASSSDSGPARTCGASGDGGRCVANGVACGRCEAAGLPDDHECGGGFTCCHATPFDCTDAGRDSGNDASDSICPAGAPVDGTPCGGSATACMYKPECPPGTGAFRELSFSCTHGKWVDALGPGPACEGPRPPDAGPSPDAAPPPNADCTSSGGAVVTEECCTSTGDFPDTCGVGACGCAPSSSHAIQVCQCPAGKCFDGKSCVSFGG